MLKTMADVCDALQRTLRLKDDTELAVYLRLSKGSVSLYRLGRVYPSRRTAYLMASALGLSAPEIVAIIESDRSRNAGDEPEITAAWRQVAVFAAQANAKSTAARTPAKKDRRKSAWQ